MELWQTDPTQVGQKRAPDLLDVVDLFLATVARIGHSGVAITASRCVQRAALAPESSEVLEVFGRGPVGGLETF